ncbi:MAG TPA: quinone-dependent dihydroorotate dehydrogenase, partial [Anaerolineales bacterium]|nr:quinone-dependent dihydroorotate dehydrogenase [Anaerolineales bacterium]
RAMMYRLFRPFLFLLSPETAHALTLYALRATQYFPLTLGLLEAIYKSKPKPVTAFGLTFKNPVGLAAGYDKDALAVKGLGALGFGHIEVGTVTPMPQSGNPKPRVFRLVEEEAVINRMGFPSRGSRFVRNQLSPVRKMSLFELVLGRRPVKSDVVLGINLGKNKSTPNEEAVLDYLSLLEDFAPYADYLTINVSSPNTVGLRALQGRAALERLLTQLHAQRKMEEAKLDKKLPLLVKLAPDLTPSELDDALDVILQTRMDGVIATNTTLAREGLRSNRQGESGGLSGGPLTVRSEAVLRQVVKSVNGKIPIVSAGGIMSPADAKRRLEMGAALVQVYTGLVYRGPGLVKQILKSL